MRDWLRWKCWELALWRRRQTERWALRIAWAMPHWLVYWCSIRLIAHATTGVYGATEVPSLPAMEALTRWERDEAD